MQPAKVLVADDSRTIRTLIHRTLSRAGYQVILACDGYEAVQCAKRERPDLVILDIQMPVMDGYAACEEILAIESGSHELPIVFLTKDTAQHLTALGDELGAYLRKPVVEENLLSVVHRLLNRPALHADRWEAAR